METLAHQRRGGPVSLTLVTGVNVCAVVGLPVHTAAPDGRGGGGDGVVLNDLLLRARWRRTPRRTALWTEVTLRLFLHSGDGTVFVCEQELLELGHLVLQHRHLVLKLHVGLGQLFSFLLQ